MAASCTAKPLNTREGNRRKKETHPRELETGRTLGSNRFALDPEGSSVNLAYSSVAPRCFSCMFSY
jgi:hypothetical protein